MGVHTMPHLERVCGRGVVIRVWGVWERETKKREETKQNLNLLLVFLRNVSLPLVDKFGKQWQAYILQMPSFLSNSVRPRTTKCGDKLH